MRFNCKPSLSKRLSIVFPIICGLSLAIFLASSKEAGARSMAKLTGIIGHSTQQKEQSLATALESKEQQAARMTRSTSASRHFDNLATKVAKTGTIRVIVHVRAPFDPKSSLAGETEFLAQNGYIAKAQKRTIEELAGYDPESVKLFEYVPYMAVMVNAIGLERLRSSSNVIDISEDGLNKTFLDRSVPLIGAYKAWTNGYTGNGQTIAILETGIDNSHPMLNGKIVSEACYSSNYPNIGASTVCPRGGTSEFGPNSAVPCSFSTSECGHGTIVAGIAAGSVTGLSGVAKDSTIISIQVYTRFDNSEICGSTAGCARAFDSDIIKGLERVYSLRNDFSIAAVNMSLGGGSYKYNCDTEKEATKAPIDLLRSVGIATIVASGNGRYTDSIAAPSCISSAISVGSSTDMQGKTDQVSDFSNSSAFLHLLAPGEIITSSTMGGGYDNAIGTSMAAPHVAGAWAIVRQKFPYATVTNILDAFISTGLSITDPRNNITKPRIRVDAALEVIDSAKPKPTVPVAPSDLVATTVSSSQIYLSWQDNSTDATNFRIRRRPTNGGNWTVVTTVSTEMTSFTDSGLSASTTYYYYVTALNANGESTASNEVSATTQAIVSPIPTAPSNLTATATSSSQITLRWQDNSSNETAFVIRRKLGSTGTYGIIAFPPSVTATFQDSGLLPGMTYYYTVSAANSSGESKVSNEARATTSPAGGGLTPAAPSKLQALAISTSQIDLEWSDNSNNESGFEIRRKTSSGASWNVIATVGPDENFYQNTGLAPGISYFYSVTAINSSGSSSSSNTASAIVPLLTFTPIEDGDETNLSIMKNENQYYRIYVPSGTVQLVVETTGSGNVDLFIKPETQPTRTSYTCRSVTSGSNERCTVNSPGAGNWHVLVFGNGSYSGASYFKLKASLKTSAGTTNLSNVEPMSMPGRSRRASATIPTMVSSSKSGERGSRE